jgi:hypothetical protein
LPRSSRTTASAIWRAVRTCSICWSRVTVNYPLGDRRYLWPQLDWLEHFRIRTKRHQSCRHLAWPIHAQTQYLPTVAITFGRRKPLGGA